MPGWVPMQAETWPLVAEALSALGRPWEPEMAEFDLRWWWDRDGELPSIDRLAKRWSWFSSTGKPAEKRIRNLIKAERWHDPIKAPDPERAQQGHNRGTTGAQRKRTKPDNPPAGGTTGAQQGHNEGDTRVVDHPAPCTNENPPNPPEAGGLTAGAQWVSDLAVRTLGEVESVEAEALEQRWAEPDTSTIDAVKARIDGADVRGLDGKVSRCRMPGAPEGLRRREIVAGLRDAVRRWGAERVDHAGLDPPPLDDELAAAS